jgi:DNA-binding LacI/PurR family transcriptional regulator
MKLFQEHILECCSRVCVAHGVAMPSIRKIAEQAGVSISTVSRALNNEAFVRPETRKLIISVANRNGYAAKMGRRIMSYVGLAFTQEITVGNPFDSAVVGGVMRGLDEGRLSLVLLNMRRDKDPGESYTQFFMRKGIRGVLLRTTHESRLVCEAIAEEGFPHVVISERFNAPRMNYVDCDSNPDTNRAIDYLLSLGHRRIAFAMHSVADQDHLDRLEGYRQALARNDLPFDENLVFRHSSGLAGGETVMKLAMSLRNRPTAIFFADPMLAIGAVNKAHMIGVRIPDDISIVGFDDGEFRHSVYPRLTAVCQDAATLGYEAALWLTRILTGEVRGSLQKTIATSFEVNQSTGPAPAIPGNTLAEHRTGRSPAPRRDRRGTTRSAVTTRKNGSSHA